MSAGESAVFRLSVVTPASEGVFHASATVDTPYETLNLPFKLRTAIGQLTMTPVLFDDAFPVSVDPGTSA